MMLKLVRSINGVQLNFSAIFGPIRLYSTSSTLPDDVVPSIASFLVQNLGFSHPQSLSTSSKLSHFRRWDGSKQVSISCFASNANSVIQLFTDYGFNRDQVREFVDYYPRILTASVDKTLKPKLKFFVDDGFSKIDVVEIFVKNPSILKNGLNSRILPSIRALKDILSCDDDVVLFLKKSTRWEVFYSVSQYLVKNVALLQSYGIPIEAIRKRLLGNLYPFLISSKLFEDVAVRVEEKLGIPRQSRSFLYGIIVLNSNSEKTIESKMEAFESFGWTQSDIKAIIRAHPTCLTLSEHRLKKSLSFLMNELGYEPKYLVSRPVFLSYGVEKRLLPRYRILSVLKEKGLIRADYSLYTAVKLTESPFLKRFVIPFKEVHELYTKLTGYNLSL